MTQTLRQPAQPLWVDVVPEVMGRLGATDIGTHQIRIWSLVLSSQYIVHRVAGPWRAPSILVPSGEAETAVDQITAFETENADWQTDWVPPSDVARPTATLVVLGLIVVFHILTVAGLFVSRAVWLSAGSAQAGLIVDGEWWRSVTALTLHADMLHVLGNVVIGGFFVIWLCREVGTGLGWLSILAAGVIGNLVNAFVQSPLHNSIGASTAVFGTIGILSALRMRSSQETANGVWIPLTTGIVLMALLGTGGERTDVGAHLFGLLAGLVLGSGLSVLIARGVFPAGKSQRRLAAGAMAVPLVAWALALY